MPDRETDQPARARSPELGQDQEWLLSLATELQRSLDVEELLQTFSDLIDEMVDHAQLRFCGREGDERFSIGAPEPHHCSYEMMLPEDRLGTITFARGAPFSESETRALENVLLNLAYPLRNALMYEEVVRASGRDGLTGLGNRAAMEAALSRAFAAANRHGDALSVVMLDVDHFKKVNDEQGHLVGDEVLRALAGLITDEIRDCDIAFRYGGDEFVIILEKTDIQGARLLAGRLRDRLATTNVVTDASEVCVTISLGIAMLEQEDSQESLLGRADAALYASKGAGRNRVTTKTRVETGDSAPANAAKKPASA